MLAIIGKIGTAGDTGYTIKFAGSTRQNLSMERRMTLCNMPIEAGTRSGLVAMDDKMIAHIKERPMAPRGDLWNQAVGHWQTLHSDADAEFETAVTLDAREIAPHAAWGTSPEIISPVDGAIPDPARPQDGIRRRPLERAQANMGLAPSTPIIDIRVDKFFIGSCTNSRIEDFRPAAEMIRQVGRRVDPGVRQALVVPGSGLVKVQVEQKGLHKIFLETGFERRSLQRRRRRTQGPVSRRFSAATPQKCNGPGTQMPAVPDLTR